MSWMGWRSWLASSGRWRTTPTEAKVAEASAHGWFADLVEIGESFGVADVVTPAAPHHGSGHQGAGGELVSDLFGNGLVEQEMPEWLADDVMQFVEGGEALPGL